jgi:hypothetical protein
MLDAGPRISQLDESLYWKLWNFAIVTSKKTANPALWFRQEPAGFKVNRPCYPNVRFL